MLGNSGRYLRTLQSSLKSMKYIPKAPIAKLLTLAGIECATMVATPMYAAIADFSLGEGTASPSHQFVGSVGEGWASPWSAGSTNAAINTSVLD